MLGFPWLLLRGGGAMLHPTSTKEYGCGCWGPSQRDGGCSPDRCRTRAHDSLSVASDTLSLVAEHRCAPPFMVAELCSATHTVCVQHADGGSTPRGVPHRVQSSVDAAETPSTGLVPQSHLAPFTSFHGAAHHTCASFHRIACIACMVLFHGSGAAAPATFSCAGLRLHRGACIPEC